MLFDDLDINLVADEKSTNVSCTVYEPWHVISNNVAIWQV